MAATIGVELNLKLTNLMAGEQLTPEYIKASEKQSTQFSLDTRYPCLNWGVSINDSGASSSFF